MSISPEGPSQREIALRFAEHGVDNPEGEAARIVEAAAAGSACSLGELVEKRLSGIPLGRLLGTEIFLEVEMLVSTDMLAPRKATELLGQSAIQRLRADGVEQPTVIDMCCGAGKLACAIATHVQEARIWASDITEACADLARRNVERLGLGDRVQVVRGDLLSSFENQGLEGNVDLVVCNPPYISTGRLEGEPASLLAHEPQEAFDGDPYGLSIQQRVMRDAVPYVPQGGTLALELGLGQERQVVALFKRVKLQGRRAWDEPELANDSHGQPRVALARGAVHRHGPLSAATI